VIDQKEHSEHVTEYIAEYRRKHGLGTTPNNQLVVAGECVIVYGCPECRRRQENGMCPHIIGQIQCQPYRENNKR